MTAKVIKRIMTPEINEKVKFCGCNEPVGRIAFQFGFTLSL